MAARRSRGRRCGTLLRRSPAPTLKRTIHRRHGCPHRQIERRSRRRHVGTFGPVRLPGSRPSLAILLLHLHLSRSPVLIRCPRTDARRLVRNRRRCRRGRTSGGSGCRGQAANDPDGSRCTSQAASGRRSWRRVRRRVMRRWATARSSSRAARARAVSSYACCGARTRPARGASTVSAIRPIRSRASASATAPASGSDMRRRARGFVCDGEGREEASEADVLGDTRSLSRAVTSHDRGADGPHRPLGSTRTSSLLN